MSHERPAVLAPLSDEEHISLCETLDRVLNKGIVIAGDAVISVADVDLIYLGLRLVLTSVETAREMRPHVARGLGRPKATEA